MTVSELVQAVILLGIVVVFGFLFICYIVAWDQKQELIKALEEANNRPDEPDLPDCMHCHKPKAPVYQCVNCDDFSWL